MTDQYSGHDRRRRGWYENSGTMLGVIVVLFIQAGGIIWWASGIEYRMRSVERMQASRSDIIQRVVRIETVLISMDKKLSEIQKNRPGPN
ncbi:hypothetical protein [Mariprofundus ferrooxydans]|uniref:hypothetical protein n=1 Tax=Mariprofundus ferrooxydans TaxID=314344 RepID=UPI0014321AC7|nr:hypothetical protein [Mariprofundus ferrooxydans]